VGHKISARKKSSLPKRTKSSRAGNKKTVGHYVQLFFISVAAGLIVFIAGYVVLPSAPPCANTKTCQTDLSAKIDNASTGTFEGHKVVPPKIDLANDTVQYAVLGASDASGEKHIYVDLSTQKLYAYQGTSQVFQTFIASGKWNRTPVGNFHIWEKLRATRMAGGEGADAYNLPNVPYVMYFYQDFGIHGAYWHNNFGHQMSHGCVNMRIVDARTVYEWADGPRGGTLGTAVSVCNSFSEPNNCVQTNPIN
jgi:lipoprotein-anchoring transpeptidase ErfK/SrfK